MPQFAIDDSSFSALAEMLNNIRDTERSGADHDLRFIYEDWWLHDTAVIEHLHLMKGSWEVRLLFAHAKQPTKFLQKRITSAADQQRAALTAYYMRKLAAKDQRGTLVINVQDLRLSNN